MICRGPKRVVKARFGSVGLQIVGALLLLILVVIVTQGQPATAQTANPWDTPAGQACFERWISESMAKLNTYDGGDEFNGRKPWSINRYGVLEGNPQFGPRSVAAPDNFPQYNYNKYWWMWDQYIPTGPLGTWRWPEWNGAGVASLRPFVLNCIAQSGGTTGGGGWYRKRNGHRQWHRERGHRWQWHRRHRCGGSLLHGGCRGQRSRKQTVDL